MVVLPYDATSCTMMTMFCAPALRLTLSPSPQSIPSLCPRTSTFPMVLDKPYHSPPFETENGIFQRVSGWLYNRATHAHYRTGGVSEV